LCASSTIICIPISAARDRVDIVWVTVVRSGCACVYIIIYLVFIICHSTIFIRISYYIVFTLENGWKRAYMATSVVLSYKNTLGYVNNNMFTSAIRKINKRRDPCQVLRTTTRHVSVLISINALSPAPRGSTTPPLDSPRPAHHQPGVAAAARRIPPLISTSNFGRADWQSAVAMTERRKLWSAETKRGREMERERRKTGDKANVVKLRERDKTNGCERWGA